MTFCASKTVNGATTNHIWDGSNIVAETDGNKQVTAKYYRGSGLISQEVSNTESYYQFNMHGDVIGLTGANGELIEDYDYDAFGNQINQSTEKSTPFRYNGEYYDEETGFTYLRARYYDPTTGRFIQEDPIKDGSNWYTYCGNNPVMFLDPSGLVITCTEADSKDIIPLLRELAGNSLEFEYKDGQINITKTYDTKNHVGQTLVADLINSSEIVNVNVGVTDAYGDINTKWPASSDPDGVIQIYIDPNDTLGNGTLYTYVEDSTGNVVEEAFPQFLIFGHELIHAWREINGLFDGNVEQGQIPYDVGLTWPAEEIKTMGINYTDTNGNLMCDYSTYNGIISENGLRLENGLNVRVSYQGWWK